LKSKKKTTLGTTWPKRKKRGCEFKNHRQIGDFNWYEVQWSWAEKECKKLPLNLNAHTK